MRMGAPLARPYKFEAPNLGQRIDFSNPRPLQILKLAGNPLNLLRIVKHAAISTRQHIGKWIA